WLARRYDRPALPDPMVEHFQRPVERALALLDERAPDAARALTELVGELRVNLPEHEEPPYELELVILIAGGAPSALQVEAIDKAMAAIHGEIDPSKIRLAQEPRVLSEEEMSVAEYFATRPLFLDYLTYAGDEVV